MENKWNTKDRDQASYKDGETAGPPELLIAHKLQKKDVRQQPKMLKEKNIKTIFFVGCHAIMCRFVLSPQLAFCAVFGARCSVLCSSLGRFLSLCARHIFLLFRIVRHRLAAIAHLCKIIENSCTHVKKHMWLLCKSFVMQSYKFSYLLLSPFPFIFGFFPSSWAFWCCFVVYAMHLTAMQSHGIELNTLIWFECRNTQRK